jgi:hypothetical protein
MADRIGSNTDIGGAGHLSWARRDAAPPPRRPDHRDGQPGTALQGLGGSVWTSDAEARTDVAGRIQTYTIGVNRHLPDPAAPFGGV